MGASTTNVTQATYSKFIVVGGGPVGVRVIEHLSQAGCDSLTLFNDEEFEPYNRVHLSSILAGRQVPAQISNMASLHANQTIRHERARVIRIDRPSNALIDDHGRWWRYHRLILTTGSHPFVPSIPGIDTPGVFTFRNMTDAQRLVARRTRSHRTVVLGGGLLGMRPRAECSD